MSERIYKFMNKVFVWLFYIILAGLFLKGEVFRVHTQWFSFTFTSVKNLVPLFIFLWLMLKDGKKVLMSVWLWLFIILAITSVIFSVYKTESAAAGLVLLIYVLWYFSLSDVLKDKKNVINTVFLMLACAGLVNIADIFFHYTVGINAILEKYPFWQGKNALGLFLVLAFCMSGTLTVKRHWAWLAGINSLLFIPGILLTYSRGAWVAGLAAVAGIMLYKIKRGIWIIVGCVIILFLFSPSFVSERISSIFSGEDTNVNQRLELWKDTLEIIKDKPVTGTGLGTFTEVYMNKYPLCAYLSGEGSRIIRHAHNLYLQMIAEAGIAGAAIFILLVIIGYIKGIRNFIKEREPAMESVRYGSLLGITVFFIYSLTDCTVSWRFTGDSFSHINLIWVMLWAIVLHPPSE